MTSANPRRTFTDEQVTSAAGLHVDNLRRLITWKAVIPLQSGGGRGRVRTWNCRQALRIAVTAQFIEAGYSLQMAHTLTYCLPLDDLLHVYDVDVLSGQLAHKSNDDLKRLRKILEVDFDQWPTSDWVGSQTVIVDRKYLYSDVLGDSPTLFAMIDADRQRVYSSWNPTDFAYGSGMTEEYGLKKQVDARRIDRDSLLVDREFFTRDHRKRYEAFARRIGPQIDSQIMGIEGLICRSYTAINLAIALTMCVRRLLGLPCNYYPSEVTYD